MRRGARSLKSESLGQRRSVRKPKTFHNFVCPASIGERPTRGPSYGCEPSIFLNGIPIGLLEKKLWFIMCGHFLGPNFWLEKSSFFTKKIKPWRLFKNRRDSTQVYTEIPLLLESSLDGFAKVVTTWFLFEILWQSEIPDFCEAQKRQIFSERRTVRITIVTVCRGDFIFWYLLFR